MQQDTAGSITARLIEEYQMKQKPNGWLQEGVCPGCGKKELYTHSEKPWIIRCGRTAKCGLELRAREIYPDLYDNWNKRYQPTAENPNATADAYMQQARGFDVNAIAGWYEQEKFWHPHGNKGTSSVRFYIDAERTIYMERLIEEVIITDPESGEKTLRKAHFRGKHRGLWWQPPGLVINDGDEVWIVEACMDAIALNLNGVKAVATLSCVNYPSTMLAQYAGRAITWVWALDNDKAGRKYARQHARRMDKEGLTTTAALVPGDEKRDWNDLHQSNKLDDSDLNLYRYHGRLLLAKSHIDKALIIFNWRERSRFHFEHDDRLFWFQLDMEKFIRAVQSLEESLPDKEQCRAKALEQCNAIHELANCYFRFLYYQANVITDESWYYCQVSFPHGGATVKNTFTGSQISGAGEFKKRLLAIAAGALYTGDTTQLNAVIKDQLHGIKTVKTIDFIGYTKEAGAYVFNDLAVKEGQVYNINAEDFFDCGRSMSIKSLNQSVVLNINTNRDQYSDAWLLMVRDCFGYKGIAALAFWLGSLFAEQIRTMHKSYPFLEIIGEPGAGKSTLIEFMWRLFGRRDYEGFDPSKSTLAARARNMSQVANMPVVLIEGDRGEDTAKAGRFDWDELKTAFNGRSVRARGMKNSGNETYEPPFRGSIVISQNAEVSASEAVLQRIVHLHFTKEHHTPATKTVAEMLERIPMEQLSGWILQAVCKEREILEVIKTKTPIYEALLLSFNEIKSVRIAKNHGQIMALVDALQLVTPLSSHDAANARAHISDLAIDRQNAINADHPIVQSFWEVFDFINGAPDNPVLNHSKDPGIIAINLPHFEKIANQHGQRIPPITDLKRFLKTSRTPKFNEIKPVNSAVMNGSVKCWTFTNKTVR